MKKWILRLLAACSLSLGLPACATVATYGRDVSDANLPLSEYYEVSVTQNGVTEALKVYMSRSNGATEGTRNDAVKNNTISWAGFSFDNEVIVRVKVKPGQTKVSGASARILPSRHGVTTTRLSDGTTEFRLSKPGQYSVEFGATGYKNGLVLFADPLEIARPLPDAAGVKACNPCAAADLANLPASTHTVFFRPGSHSIGRWTPPGHVKTVYLAGGARVNGAIFLASSANNDTTIRGRGMLDGRGFGAEKIHMIESASEVSGIRVEGITISQPSAFAVRLLGTDNLIEWVKTPGGWRFNNDGLVGYARTLIRHCFVWANDDGIKLYRDDQTVHDIVAWHLTNGGVFQWAWSTVSARNIRVKDVDVLHGEWPGDGLNQGVFNIRGSALNPAGVQLQEDWEFRNIRVETPVKVLFNLAPQVAHKVNQMRFINVNAQVSADVINRIQGKDSLNKISNVAITDLKLNGTCITAANAASTGRFSLVNTSNVSFVKQACL